MFDQRRGANRHTVGTAPRATHTGQAAQPPVGTPYVTGTAPAIDSDTMTQTAQAQILLRWSRERPPRSSSLAQHRAPHIERVALIHRPATGRREVVVARR